MRPFSPIITATAGGTTYSKVYVVDTYNNPCNIGIGITSTGSALYTLQHTFANPFAMDLNNPTTATWLNSTTIVSATGNQDTNYAFPPSAIRLALHDATSATATLNIIQAGICC